jgi:mono/diheme cytochrome c family protein
VKTKLLLAAGLAALAVALTGCGAVGHEDLDVQAAHSSAAKQAFTSNCGGCHVLSDAGTQGTTGPNLDDAFACAEQQGFAQSTIRDVIRGQIDYASPPMPRGLVKGEQADAVADYVATVAGEGVACTHDAQPKTNGE